LFSLVKSLSSRPFYVLHARVDRSLIAKMLHDIRIVSDQYLMEPCLLPQKSGVSRFFFLLESIRVEK